MADDRQAGDDRPPAAINGTEEELACYAGCTQQCMQVCAGGLDSRG